MAGTGELKSLNIYSLRAGARDPPLLRCCPIDALFLFRSCVILVSLKLIVGKSVHYLNPVGLSAIFEDCVESLLPEIRALQPLVECGVGVILELSGCTRRFSYRRKKKKVRGSRT